MKILGAEEKQANWDATVYGGIKGAIGGACLSAFIFTFGKKRYPAIGRLPTAFRTALAIGPPTFGASLVGELASLDFESKLYHDDPRVVQRHMEEARRWQRLLWSERAVESVSNHKYKIIVGAWAASMYGLWVLVDRDPVMTKTQKLVQARVYAQFLTVLLLLSSVGLSMYEENNDKAKHQANPVDNAWRDIVDDEEKAELARGESTRLSADELNYTKKTRREKSEAS